MEYLTELQPWHWLVLCFVLLGFEALGTGGFLLGAAAAGVVQAFIVWLVPSMDWPAQLGVFGVMTLVFTVGWWVFFRKSGQNSKDPLLNNRAAQMIGRVVVLETDLPGGHGRIQIGDTQWKVLANSTLSSGTMVMVSGAEGMTLLLKTHTEK